MLDYMEIYKPRMDGHTPPGDVADTVGTITTSIHVAQDMFLAGLPWWLIRPSSAFCDEKISVIGEIFNPKEYVNLNPHKFNYLVIFKGVATDLQKYCAMETFACNFLCSRDPFALSCTMSLAGTSQPSTSSTLTMLYKNIKHTGREKPRYLKNCCNHLNESNKVTNIVVVVEATICLLTMLYINIQPTGQARPEYSRNCCYHPSESNKVTNMVV